jgi:hypothetical protein
MSAFALATDAPFASNRLGRALLSLLYSYVVWACSSVGRAMVSKTIGPGFEPLRARQRKCVQDAKTKASYFLGKRLF